MSEDAKRKWILMVSKIEKIQKLRRRVEENPNFNLESLPIIEEALSGRIMNNLVQIESFLRELLKEVEKE